MDVDDDSPGGAAALAAASAGLGAPSAAAGLAAASAVVRGLSAQQYSNFTDWGWDLVKAGVGADLGDGVLEVC